MKKNKILLVSSMFMLATMSSAQQSQESLYNSFLNPPTTSRPCVWWHWMNGNITKDGLRKDLLWMNRAGIAGFHVFDGQLAMKQIVKRVPFLSPEWKDCYHEAIALGDSLGMEMTATSSGGWSETGGPWVKPADGMKRLEWRRVDVTGGKKVVVRLPEGFDNTGRYQNEPFGKRFGVESEIKNIRYYHDIAVIAMKLPEAYKTLRELNPKVTTSGGQVDIDKLDNDDVNDYMVLQPDTSGWCWVQFEFPQPQTLRSFSCVTCYLDNYHYRIYNRIECSDDGVNFRELGTHYDQRGLLRSHNIKETKAKYFRYLVKGVRSEKAEPMKVSVLRPSVLNIVEASGDKAGFEINRYIYDYYTTPKAADVAYTRDVVDLTSKVKNGVLTWNAPAGRWRIFRMGYGLTGKANHPATLEGTGLEVDKMDIAANKRYWDNILAIYKDATKGMIGKKGITAILNDSYEAGPQNWTPNMINEFKKRRGYDLLPWMPALTGVIMNSTDDTERFLFDYRTTIGELFRDCTYKFKDEYLHKHNLKTYTEVHGGTRGHLGDGMDCKSTADVPMGEFWANFKQGWTRQSRYECDIRESASVCDIYGQPYNAAESFSCGGYNDGAFVFHPGNLKINADFAFSCGLTRIVVHESSLQPVDDKFPGIGLGRWGQWFNRHETWAEQAKPWTDYLARTSYMLQQGRNVADIALYYGEDNNALNGYCDKQPVIPKGYEFDFVNKTALMEKLKADNGDLVSATGMRFKVLYLKNTQLMSMPMLKRVKELADAGVNILGKRPEFMANLMGDPDEFNKIADDIWNSGRKNVFSDMTLAEVLRMKGVEPDIECSPADTTLYYRHRTCPNGEIYWLSNTDADYHNYNISFRTSGRKPYIWHADTGEKEEAAYMMVNGRTIVQVPMVPHDAVFVTFFEPTQQTRFTKPSTMQVTLQTINTPWQVAFQENRGAPAKTAMNNLRSLSESPKDSIKYFSGTATYTTSFNWSPSADVQKAKKFYLNLGNVYEMAHVTLNGKPLELLWHTPYKADVTDLLREGNNTLQVAVTNTWHNRLVGDVQPGVKKRVTFFSIDFFGPKEPLMPSGLVGPVTIEGSY